MPADLDDLLTGAVARDDSGLPDAHETWEAGRRRRRRTQVMTGGAAVLAVVAAVGLGSVLFDLGPNPAPIIDEPTPGEPTPTEPDPTPSPTVDAAPVPEPDETPTGAVEAPVDTAAFDRFAGRWVAASGDGRMLFRWDGSVVALDEDEAVPYPFQLRSLPGGAVVWQPDFGDVLALLPGDVRPLVLAEATEDGNPMALTGTGVVDGVAVAILETSEARSLNDDPGGAVVARRLDGTEVPVTDVEFSWEYSQGTQVLIDGWRVDATASEASFQWLLTAPDGTTTVLAEESDGDGGVDIADITLTTGTTEGVPWLVTMLREPREDAPYGRTVFEVRPVTQAADDLTFRTEVPALDQGIPKQLQVRDGFAYVTLLPDFPMGARIDLATGDVEEFGADGVVAIEPDWRGHHDQLAAAFVTSQITFDGWGPLALGMTRGDVVSVIGDQPLSMECGSLEAAPYPLHGVGLHFDADDRLVRIDAHGSNPWAVTPAPTAGVGVGRGPDGVVDALRSVGLDAVEERVPDLLYDLDGNEERRFAARQGDLLLAWTVIEDPVRPWVDGRIGDVRVGEASVTEVLSSCA